MSAGGSLDTAVAAAVAAAVPAANGRPIRAAASVAGGDIHQAYRVTLADGSTRFVKTSAGAGAEMFETEARGLGLLASSATLRIPEVIAVGAAENARGSEQGFLVLEDLGAGRPRSGFDEQLGRGLAALHRFGLPAFGLDHDNFIGTLPQRNAPLPGGDGWAAFYRERRLAPLVARAASRGLGDGSFRSGFERLFAKLDQLVGPAEPPALLHGDLWGGNLHIADSGEPCLVDPAVYGGHREIDLAMMRLFGGFSARCFDAYDEAYPLAPGAEARVPLYQLYPLLVHVNLFGSSYVASVKRALSSYG